MGTVGYDTTSVLYSGSPPLASHAASTYGTPNFWLRYFSPCPDTAVNSSQTNAIDECRAAWNSGGHYLAPICDPPGSREASNSSSEGHADAQTFAAALVATWLDVPPLQTPTNNRFYCWLDVEASTNLSANYWSGWAAYIDGYYWSGEGTYPLYPAMYCNPCAITKNCSTVAASSYYCYEVWSSEHQECGYSLRSLPSYSHAETCTGCGVSVSTPTGLWQFADQNVCGLSVNVDMDYSNVALTANMFWMSSRP